VEHIVFHAGKLKKIITVDPNPYNPLDWTGVTAVKPNRSEAYAAAQIPLNDSESSLTKVGTTLLKKWDLDALLITLGEHGMALFEHSQPMQTTHARAQQVFDVSGAGDTAIAFFTCGLAIGLNAMQAAELANHAAGIVVGKLGTATLSPKELIKNIQHHES
jgi:D-beta-D-heptose 7-phosphate kinase/D-beta-D-heptose 1-phosphate adenosyltransferase